MKWRFFIMRSDALPAEGWHRGRGERLRGRLRLEKERKWDQWVRVRRRGRRGGMEGLEKNNGEESSWGTRREMWTGWKNKSHSLGIRFFSPFFFLSFCSRKTRRKFLSGVCLDIIMRWKLCIYI